MSDSAVQEATPKGKILSFPFRKINEEKREVWGYATTEALDQQGEIVDYEASVRAFEKWTGIFEKTTGGKSLGNVREMHGPKSVGKVIAYQPDPESRGIWVGAKVTKSQEGDDAWQKIKDGVLNGFSIGAPRAERRQEYHGTSKVNRVVDYDLAELSLVDNPACPESFFHEIKVATTSNGPAYRMELLKRFDDSDPKPSGADLAKAAPKESVIKSVELNPDTFVDGSGEVWTRLGGKVMKREKPMSDANELEKAGKKVGPAHKPVAHPPGPDKGVEEDPGFPEKQEGSGMGKDAVPASNPELGGDGANDGRNAGNATQEKQVKGEKEGPPGQGAKAADVIGAHDEAAEHNDADMKTASAGFSYCAMCGGKMKSVGDNIAPYHQRCVEEKKKSASAGKTAAVGITEEGLAKSVASILNPVLKTVNDNFAAVMARLEKIEKSPAPGGPARAELPGGMVAVEKATGKGGSPQDADMSALEKAVALVEDPMARDAISKQVARSAIKAVQNQRVMG